MPRLVFLVFNLWQRSHACDTEAHTHAAKVDNISMLQQFRLERVQREFTYTRLVATLEILDGEEGLFVADARLLPRYGLFGIELAQIDIGSEISLGIAATNDDALLRH